MGMPGKPPPLPRSTNPALSRRSGTAARLSTTWRRATSAGSRIAVRLIAAFHASSRRTWWSIDWRAADDRLRASSARPASSATA
jgi:hypothetical protein